VQIFGIFDYLMWPIILWEALNQFASMTGTRNHRSPHDERNA
jgi:hypothetical protein